MKLRSRLCGLVLMGLVIGALLLVLLAGGCSTAPPSPTTSETSTTATKPYGSLIVQTNMASQGGHVDPHLFSSVAPYIAMGAAIFDSLIELNPMGEPIPGIAERWEIAPDGMSHIFHIRKGVKFHDGSDLTGADVKFSLERMWDPKSVNGFATIWRQAVASVELRDDYTVVLRVKSPQFDLLTGIENLLGSGAVVPKKYIEEKGLDYFETRPMGSGPWKVLSYQLGVRMELEAFESHWRAVPKFKNVTLLAVDEEATKVAMLKTGELDIASVTPDSIPGLKSAGLRLASYRGGTQYTHYNFYDLARPEQYALGDVRVRKALSLAINRQEISSQLLGGYGGPRAVFMVPPSASFYDPNVLKPDPYDPEQAKKLLVEAGHPNGFNTKVWTSGVLNDTVLNLAVAGYWKKIGINAEIVAKEKSAIQAMWSPKPAPETYDTVVGSVVQADGFQFEKVLTTFHSRQGGIKNINNPRLDALIERALQMPPSDEKKRIQLEAVVMGKNEYTRVGVLGVDTVLALGSKVGGLTPVAGVPGLAYSLVNVSHAK